MSILFGRFKTPVFSRSPFVFFRRRLLRRSEAALPLYRPSERSTNPEPAPPPEPYEPASEPYTSPPSTREELMAGRSVRDRVARWQRHAKAHSDSVFDRAESGGNKKADR